MWWGGFSEATENRPVEVAPEGLNPHVVGRFFREELFGQVREEDWS